MQQIKPKINPRLPDNISVIGALTIESSNHFTNPTTYSTAQKEIK